MSNKRKKNSIEKLVRPKNFKGETQIATKNIKISEKHIKITMKCYSHPSDLYKVIAKNQKEPHLPLTVEWVIHTIRDLYASDTMWV